MEKDIGCFSSHWGQSRSPKESRRYWRDQFFLPSTLVCFHNPFVQLATGLCPTDKACLWEHDVTTHSSTLFDTYFSEEWIWLFQELVFQGGHTKVAFSWDAVIHKQYISRPGGAVMAIVVYTTPDRQVCLVLSLSWRSVLSTAHVLGACPILSSRFLMMEKSLPLAHCSGGEFLPFLKIYTAFFFFFF